MRKMLLPILGCVVLLAAGCNKQMDMTATTKAPETQNQAQTQAGEAGQAGQTGQMDASGELTLPESYDLVMTLGAETSSTYAMGIQIGEYFNETAPQVRCTVKAGAAGSNIELANAGQTVISHTQSDLIHSALAGTDSFTEKKENFRGVATVMESVFHLAVAADAPVNSLDEIIEQKYPLKVSVGAQGSGIESLFRKVLAIYGVTYEDIESWGGRIEFLSMSEAATLFKDDQLNAVTILAGVPYSGITEVATARDIKFIDISDKAKDALLQDGYMEKAIPAGSYKGQDEDVASIGVSISVIASDTADEAVIYEITKFLNSEEGIQKLSDVNSGYANYMKGPETGVAGMECELHPGAKRYYEEAGVLK